MRDIPAVPDHDIELSGGALALDFANTVGGTHVLPTHDHLRSYADIVRFTELADGLDGPTAKRLAQRAEQDPRRAAAVYELGIALREAIWGVFSAIASGEAPRDADLALIGDAAAAGRARERLVYDRSGVGWSLPADGDALERPLWEIASSAAEAKVITGLSVSRLNVTVCEAVPVLPAASVTLHIFVTVRVQPVPCSG